MQMYLFRPYSLGRRNDEGKEKNQCFLIWKLRNLNEF